VYHIRVTPQELYEWYYEPGEVLRSIGFYINPYDQWKHAKFRHVFAFDGNCNLYVGQFSVYQEHIGSMFERMDKREHGLLLPKSNSKPIYSGDTPNLTHFRDIIDFKFLETKNITYLNRRLKKICQRLYDYGMPSDTLVVSNQVDLWNPTINEVCKGNLVSRSLLTN
jgi:hypothetical protein